MLIFILIITSFVSSINYKNNKFVTIERAKSTEWIKFNIDNEKKSSC